MIYLDNAATTPITPEVQEAMAPFLHTMFGNPSSVHAPGREARHAVDKARRALASQIFARPQDIVFTSGGTEANHSALFGTFLSRRTTHPHIITSVVEHHAVLHTLDFLKGLGAQVTYLPVDEAGRVSVDALLEAIRPETGMVSIMAVNNEIGTIQPIPEIVEQVKARRPDIVVHSDMVQALPFIKHPIEWSNVDLATFSAHKIHGPKGIGALYLRPNTPWTPVLYGGQQESRRRGGTENVAGIVGFGAAIQGLSIHQDNWTARISMVKQSFIDQLRSEEVSFVMLSPEGPISAPTILSIALPDVRNDTFLMRLDLDGVAASAGSACTAGSIEPSHVIEAIGHADWTSNVVRFSFSHLNTIEEVTEAARTVSRIAKSLN